MDGESEKQRSAALLRILEAVSASGKFVVVTSAIMGTLALFPGLQLPPEVAAIAGGVGVEAIGSIIDRIAYNDDLSPEEIRAQVEDIIAQSGLDELLTKDDFYHAFSYLLKRQKNQSEQNESILRTVQRIENSISTLTEQDFPDEARDADEGAGTQLIINMEVEPTKVYSSYGLWQHMGGPAPPLEGTTDLQIVLENLSKRPARSIKADIEVRLLTDSRPSCSRIVNIPTYGWSRPRIDKHFWHFRFDGDLDDVCLANDTLPLGVMEFRFIMVSNSQDFNAIESEDYTSLEATVLKSPIFLAVQGNYYHQVYQDRILRIYSKNPAADLFIIRLNVRAEGFTHSLSETEFRVFWSDSDIPNLSEADSPKTSFDFHEFRDHSSVAELRAALLDIVPLGSDAKAILDFLAENNIPYASDRAKGIGVTDALETHSAIGLILRVRNSHRLQATNFLFDEEKKLKDITVELHP